MSQIEPAAKTAPVNRKLAHPGPKSTTAGPKSPPLSNAERQRRWRERLKAKASGAAVADHARDVVARAIQALWAYHERPGPGGTRWADVDGCRTIEDYVFDLAADENGLIAAVRAFLPGFDGLAPEEARAIAALIDLADVIALRDRREEAGIGHLPATAKPEPQPRRARSGPTRAAVVPMLALVQPAMPDAPEPEPADVQPIKPTAARHARRHGLKRKWK